MMRITSARGSNDRTTLRLEGSISAEWADLLERECSGLFHAGASIALDLTRVVFVDRLGIETLRRLDRKGVEIRCRSGAVAGVLEAEGLRLTHMPARRRRDASRKGGGPAAE